MHLDVEEDGGRSKLKNKRCRKKGIGQSVDEKKLGKKDVIVL